jgi:hypothetical protein
MDILRRDTLLGRKPQKGGEQGVSQKAEGKRNTQRVSLVEGDPAMVRDALGVGTSTGSQTGYNTRLLKTPPLARARQPEEPG